MVDVVDRDRQSGWILHRDVTADDSGALLLSLDPGVILASENPRAIRTDGVPAAILRLWADTINKEIEIEVKTVPHSMGSNKPTKGTVLFRGTLKTSGSPTVNKMPIDGDPVSATTFYEAAEEGVAGHTIKKSRRVWFDPESGSQVAGYDMQMHIDLLDDAAVVVQIIDKDGAGRVLVGVKLV